MNGKSHDSFKGGLSSYHTPSAPCTLSIEIYAIRAQYQIMGCGLCSELQTVRVQAFRGTVVREPSE